MLPLLKNGKPIAQLQAAEIHVGNEKWSNAIVLYVVGFYPTIAAIHRFISQQWSNFEKLEVFWHDNGYFVINLCLIDDKNVVLCSGPHMINGKPAMVKPLINSIFMMKY